MTNYQQHPYGQGPYTHPQQSIPPKRKSHKWLWVIIASVALLCVGGSVIAAVLASTSGSTPSATPTWDAPAPEGQNDPEPTHALTKGTLTAGTWAVGSEATPGSYKTVAPKDEFIGCVWQRLKSDDGSFDAIIASEIIEPGVAGRLQIKKSDKFIKLSGGCVWTPVK